MTARTALIVNARSRRGASVFKAAKVAIADGGVELHGAVLTRSPQSFQSHLQTWKDDGIETVFVGGGDGTQAAAAEVFIGSAVRLGVLPLGTGNALARDLGIPDDIRKAVSLLLEGSEEQIDLGLANGKVFVNVATLGLTASIVRHLNGQAKKRFGKLAYLPAAFHSVLTMRPFEAHVRTEVGEFHGPAVQMVVGCGVNHAGPFPISRHASQLSGKLSSYVVPYDGKAGLVRYAWDLLRRRHVASHDIWFAEAARIEVETRPKRTVVIDGELRQKSPLEARVVPAALWVLKPAAES